ncbi:hypothetical protein [Serratia proteamaculans]
MKNIILVLALAISFGTFSTAVNASIICFEDGTCIDIGDIGNHP